MRLLGWSIGAWLAALLLAGGAAPARADAPPDPLRLVPGVADLLVEVPQPRRLVEAFTTLDVLKQLQQFDQVRELVDSTTYRRFYQLVAYYEKQFGLKWPELLDRLAGGGAVFAVKLGPDPAPGLIVVQSKDEQLLKKFAKAALDVLEQELARQESKERPEKVVYRNIETVHLGKGLHAAVAGSALLISNNETALRRSIDLHLDGSKKSITGHAGVGGARKLLPPDPLAWLWLNMETVHKAPQAKEVFMLPRNDINLTVGFGSVLDIAGRSPFLCAGFYRQKDGFLTTVRMPRGREGMTPALSLHVAPAGRPGWLPLLEPPGVIYSASSYLDISKFWEDRAKLFNAKQVKTFEDFDKNSGKFLLGHRFSELAAQAGPYQRFIVANQAKTGYKTVPQQRIPAFALVTSLRRPAAFSKSIEGILRAAAFLARFQFKIKLVEEKHGDHKIIGYRFPDDASLAGDVNNIRLNFSPCFVTVGDQFVACSTLELGHQLVDLLDKEAKRPAGTVGLPVERGQLYAAGVGEALEDVKEQLFAQTVLGQALPPEEARQQVRALIDWVRGLGVLRFDGRYESQATHYDIQMKLGASRAPHEGTRKDGKASKKE